MEEHDVKVQTARDAQKALIDQEPNLKRELDEANRAVQESKAKLKGFLVIFVCVNVLMSDGSKTHRDSNQTLRRQNQGKYQ